MQLCVSQCRYVYKELPSTVNVYENTCLSHIILTHARLREQCLASVSHAYILFNSHGAFQVRFTAFQHVIYLSLYSQCSPIMSLSDTSSWYCPDTSMTTAP